MHFPVKATAACTEFLATQGRINTILCVSLIGTTRDCTSHHRPTSVKRLFEVLSINPAATNCILRYNHVLKYVWSDAIAPLMLVRNTYDWDDSHCRDVFYLQSSCQILVCPMS